MDELPGMDMPLEPLVQSQDLFEFPRIQSDPFLLGSQGGFPSNLF